MTADPKRIDQIIQYSLLIAGEEDDFVDRSLGPIHLIKYVYLADLAYARKSQGESYTGVDWQFYKFGPWSQQVNERIHPAVSAINADVFKFESQFEGKEDWYRFRLTDESLLTQISRDIPPTISMNLRSNVHRFLQDTPSLLDYVYKTEPMLEARPNERLDLRRAKPFAKRSKIDQELMYQQLSNKKKKKLGERVKGLQKKRRVERSKLINPVTAPRYDNVYVEGLTFLDDVAGPQLSETKLTAEFSDDVWTSQARKGPDVPR